MFQLTEHGLLLRELAPGIDIERDILAQMRFRPIIDRPAMIDPVIFQPQAMGLRARPLVPRAVSSPGGPRRTGATSAVARCAGRV